MGSRLRGNDVSVRRRRSVAVGALGFLGRALGRLGFAFGHATRHFLLALFGLAATLFIGGDIGRAFGGLLLGVRRVFLGALLIQVGYIATDICYALVDPRIRLS